MDAGFDLTSVTPEEFAALVAAADDDQIVQAIRGLGTDRVLDRIFAGMCERFLPERARGVEARLQFVVTDDGDSHPYVVEISGGTCRASRGEVDNPTVRLELPVLDFAKLTAGKADGPRLFMAGRLKLKGDVLFAARIMSFFDRPRAA